MPMTHCIQHVQSFYGFVNELLKLQVRSGLQGEVTVAESEYVASSISCFTFMRGKATNRWTFSHIQWNIWMDWCSDIRGAQMMYARDSILWLFLLKHQQLLINGFERNISTTTGWTAIKSGSDVHAPLRMNCKYPGDPFSRAQSPFQFGFMTKKLPSLAKVSTLKC